ncbi:MAG: hypothetical protein IKG18_16845 [Atopobiaceae bacterium]|nr:hypothetical protein [Atopobiaceae bacterium]
MEQERKRIKRAAVSDETRHGRRRAAVNPNAQKVDGSDHVERTGRVDKSGREYEGRFPKHGEERGGVLR